MIGLLDWDSCIAAKSKFKIFGLLEVFLPVDVSAWTKASVLENFDTPTVTALRDALVLSSALCVEQFLKKRP
jgi:hypothetical protein